MTMNDFTKIDLSYEYWTPELGDSVKCILLMRDNSDPKHPFYLMSKSDNSDLFRVAASNLPIAIELYYGHEIKLTAMNLNQYHVTFEGMGI